MLLNKELPWKPYWPKTPASLYYSLYVSTTTSLRRGRKKNKNLFFAFHCCSAFIFRRCLWYTGRHWTNSMALNTPLPHFQTENMTFSWWFSQDGHRWRAATFTLACCHGVLLRRYICTRLTGSFFSIMQVSLTSENLNMMPRFCHFWLWNDILDSIKKTALFLLIRIHAVAGSVHAMRARVPVCHRSVFIRVSDRMRIAEMPAVVTFIGQLIAC